MTFGEVSAPASSTHFIATMNIKTMCFMMSLLHVT